MSLLRNTIGRKKRNRFVMNLEQKINILDRLARGEGPTAIGHLLNVNESTIRTIKRNEKSIRASFLYSTSTSAKIACIPRNPNVEKAEKVLHIWITEQLQKRVPLTAAIIREKAKRLYSHFVQKSENINRRDKEFNASKGWFEKFKRRNKLENIKLLADCEPESVIERLELFDDMGEHEIDNLLEPQEDKIDIVENKIDIVENKIDIVENKIEIVEEPEMPETKLQIIKIPEKIQEIPEENIPYNTFENVNIKSEICCDEDTEIQNLQKSNHIELHDLNQGMVMAYHLVDHFTAIDPISERSLNFRKGLEKLLQPYEKLQQQTINVLFKKE